MSKRLPREAPNKLAQNNEIDVAVDEMGPGREKRFLFFNHLQAAGITCPIGLQVQRGSKAGIVRQEIAHGDLFFAATFKLRPVVGNRVFEIQLPHLHQLHHRGGCCDDLRQGSNIEDGIYGHG